MKKSRIVSLLGALLIAPLVLTAASVDSQISAVTVYTDRAVVTRTATVGLSGGIAELVFANLPQTLNEQSLQVSGMGTATALILDVHTKQTYVDFTPNSRVQELEDQLRGLNKQARGIDDQRSVLQAQSTMLDRMETALFAPPTKDVPRPDLNQFTGSLTYLTEQRSRVTTERATLDESREEVQNKINTVQQQLNELRGSGGRSYKTVTVRVSAAQAGNLQIALSYTMPGATWSPNYDARVLSSDRAVDLGYFGMVRQNTGEDWKNVALTLSTARPSFGGAAPELSAWNLDVYVPQPMGQVRMEAQAKMMNAPAALRMQSGAESDMTMEMKDANMAAATIEAGATSASFKIEIASSIPSDNSPQKIFITSTQLSAQSEYNTTPKSLTTAFLTSRVHNNSEFPLLAGAMNVFLDGTFVATSRLRTVMPGERFELALGADEGISVKHQRVNKFTEETGVFSKDHRITYEYLITIQNNKRTSVRVIISDQVPISRNEKIAVALLSPAEKEVKPDEAGILKWTLDLKPAEQRELKVKFTVEYPSDVNVSGLE
jgi:uncharacterized protein (TIGR02231 family)|uniref:mucoidy inhibitor MuiA family protein n=2 Tax=Cephaloticoccus sp. TaxID=1985742 RepID=UPI00404A9022